MPFIMVELQGKISTRPTRTGFLLLYFVVYCVIKDYHFPAEV